MHPQGLGKRLNDRLRNVMTRLGAQLRTLRDHERSLEIVLTASQVLGMAAGVVIARSLGPSGRGTITTVAVWGQALGWLAGMSLDKAVIVGARHDPHSAHLLSVTARRMAGTVALIAALALSIVGAEMLGGRWTTIVMASVIIGTVYSDIFAAQLLATGQRRMFLAYRLVQPLCYVTFVVLVALTGRDTQAMLVAIPLSTFVSLALFWRLRSRGTPSLSVARSLIIFALGAQASNAFQYLNSRLDLLVLSAIATSAEIGQYAVGASIGQLPLFLGAAAAIRGLTTGSERVDWRGAAGTAAIGLIVAAASAPLVSVVFGPSFRGAVPVAQVLAAGAGVNFALQGASGALIGRGMAWAGAACHALGALGFSVGLILLRTPTGIAVASVTSSVIALLCAMTVLNYSVWEGPIGRLRRRVL